MTVKIKPRILVVDDEADIRASIRMILEYEGMELVEAASGPEALKRADEGGLDAVLSEQPTEKRTSALPSRPLAGFIARQSRTG